MVFSKLPAKCFKMRNSESLIKPVSYGYETWVLKDIHEQRLKSAWMEGNEEDTRPNKKWRWGVESKN
jgi:hypothetical protein